MSDELRREKNGYLPLRAAQLLGSLRLSYWGRITENQSRAEAAKPPRKNKGGITMIALIILAAIVTEALVEYFKTIKKMIQIIKLNS